MRFKFRKFSTCSFMEVKYLMTKYLLEQLLVNITSPWSVRTLRLVLNS